MQHWFLINICCVMCWLLEAGGGCGGGGGLWCIPAASSRVICHHFCNRRLPRVYYIFCACLQSMLVFYLTPSSHWQLCNKSYFPRKFIQQFQKHTYWWISCLCTVYDVSPSFTWFHHLCFFSPVLIHWTTNKSSLSSYFSLSLSDADSASWVTNIWTCWVS